MTRTTIKLLLQFFFYLFYVIILTCSSRLSLDWPSWQVQFLPLFFHHFYLSAIKILHVSYYLTSIITALGFGNCKKVRLHSKRVIKPVTTSSSWFIFQRNKSITYRYSKKCNCRIRKNLSKTKEVSIRNHSI